MLARRSKGDFGPKGAVGTTIYTVEELQGRAAANSSAGHAPVGAGGHVPGEGDGAGVGGDEGGGADADEDSDDVEMIVRAGSGAAWKTPTKAKPGRRCADGRGNADTASVYQGTVVSESGIASDLKDGRRCSGQDWIEALNLQKILSGQRLGREKSFAEQAMHRYLERTFDAYHV